MSQPQDRLEHLITRSLDGEISPAERRELRALLRRDPVAEALFDETTSLDREIGRALRWAGGRNVAIPWWSRALRAGGLGAAASIAALFWFSPQASHTDPEEPVFAPPRQQAGAWFAPPPRNGNADAFVPVQPPTPAASATGGEWIVVPGARPGEYMIVEVRRAGGPARPTRPDF